MEVFEEFIPLMLSAAASSGSFLRGRFLNATIVSQEGRDIKLSEDKESEKIILERLLSETSLGLLSEEAGWVRPRKSETDLYWVLDPLDGSYNFAMGVPLCAVSLALCRGREPIIGCVYDFLRNDIVYGGKKIGIHNKSKQILRPVRGGNILSSGIPVASKENQDALQFVAEQSAHWRKVRMIGSAALSLSWVSQGKFDGYSETGIKWWDVAGGLALVEGAGGKISVTGNIFDSPIEVRAEFR